MSRKGKRKNRKQQQSFKNNFVLRKDIGPMTSGQQLLFDFYEDGINIVCDGCAGTGKTFVSLFLALEEMMKKSTPYEKIIIVRSAVATRDQGFLPGSLEEKMSVFEAPYQAMFTELFGRGDAYETFKKKKYVEVLSSSYVRGITIDDAIIIVDEAQNMNFHEIDSIMTRVGENARLIICGDREQDDLQNSRNRSDKSGMSQLIGIVDNMDSDLIDIVEFDEDDIVRSGFVKAYLKAKNYH